MIVSHSTGQYEILFQPVQVPDGILVTDQNVYRALPQLFAGRNPIILTPGEQTKSLGEYGKLCSQLVERRATRKTVLVAIGGGVIGDLVGFAAATYMRGVPYVQIPTTLLAQVDSSVGGKTAIDLPEGKNLVGSFYPPTHVQIDTSLLRTLGSRDFRCGVAEVIKYGFIQDAPLVELLRSEPTTLQDPRIPDIVRRCVEIKARMVQEDEFETTGLRAQLNFGHTIGHALEQITGYSVYTHGEAIALGMIVETKIAEKIGFADLGFTAEVENVIASHGLLFRAPELKNSDRIIELMRKDKKSSSGELTMSLVSRTGQCALMPNVDQMAVREVLDEY